METKHQDWQVKLNTFFDNATVGLIMERGRFARICIVPNLHKKLVPRVTFRNSIFNVEYEGLGFICFACGRYGHHRENSPWVQTYHPSCNSVSEDHKDELTKTVSASAKPLTISDEFGSWMLVEVSIRADLKNPVTP